MTLTDKQLQILAVVLKGNGTDPATKVFDPVDLDQLIERLAYKPTKASIQFSIRALMKHGLIERGGQAQRRGRQRRLILATDLGRQTATLAVNPGFVGGTTPTPVPIMEELRETDPSDAAGLLISAGSSEEMTLETPEVIDL